MRESLEKYSTGFPDSNQKNSILIDLILLMDIFQTIKSAKYLIKGIIDKKLGDLSTFEMECQLAQECHNIAKSETKKGIPHGSTAPKRLEELMCLPNTNLLENLNEELTKALSS